MNDSLLMLMSSKIVVSTHSPRNDAMATISKGQFYIPAMTRRIAVVVKTESLSAMEIDHLLFLHMTTAGLQKCGMSISVSSSPTVSRGV